MLPFLLLKANKVLISEQELYDRFTEKITNGRVRHYADLTGKDLKLVQFTMAMMNQRPMVPMACLEQDLLSDDSRMLMVTNSNIGYQVSVKADGSMTFKGFTHGNVTGISNGIGLDVVTDKEKSDVGYSFEITFSAKSIDRILEHDRNDPSVSWVKADKREFFFTCHLEA